MLAAELQFRDAEKAARGLVPLLAGSAGESERCQEAHEEYHTCAPWMPAQELHHDCLFLASRRAPHTLPFSIHSAQTVSGLYGTFV